MLEKYPMQPKKHSLEFLRENAHLRIRTNMFGAIMRVRSTLAFAVHQYFQEQRLFLCEYANYYRFRCRRCGRNVPGDRLTV